MLRWSSLDAVVVLVALGAYAASDAFAVPGALVTPKQAHKVIGGALPRHSFKPNGKFTTVCADEKYTGCAPAANCGTTRTEDVAGFGTGTKAKTKAGHCSCRCCGSGESYCGNPKYNDCT